MDLLSPTTQISFGATLLLAIAFLMYQPTGLVKWLQKKNYQYEVTFSLYMLTPTEKFVFNSVLFLTFSMITIAITLYLPNHLSMIMRRGYYYFAGEAAISDISAQAASTAGKASEAVFGLAETAYQATVDTMEAAQEAVSQVGQGR
ncbi:hypothetical protein LTR85_008109 [Meristemomyces frigidus]|nr:hypothetical protein LTR85_008109 [Meristemomyces frigidus]